MKALPLDGAGWSEINMFSRVLCVRCGSHRACKGARDVLAYDGGRLARCRERLLQAER